MQNASIPQVWQHVIKPGDIVFFQQQRVNRNQVATIYCVVIAPNECCFDPLYRRVIGYCPEYPLGQECQIPIVNFFGTFSQLGFYAAQEKGWPCLPF